MSSVYLPQGRGEMSQQLKNLSSRSPKKMTAYGRAIFVANAVSLSGLENKRLCSKFLFFKTLSANSVRDSQVES